MYDYDEHVALVLILNENIHVGLSVARISLIFLLIILKVLPEDKRRRPRQQLTASSWPHVHLTWTNQTLLRLEAFRNQ